MMKASCLFFLLVLNLHDMHGNAYGNAIKDSLKTKIIKPEYEVFPLEEVNTKNSEFCPVPYFTKLLFVTNQLKDLVNNESIDNNGNPYVDIFSAEIKNNKAGNVIPFSKSINGPYHDGPVSFNNDLSQLYLTRVEYINKKTKNYANKAKLLIFDKKENKWSAPVSFKYNNEAYSTGHASVSKDGQYLFFTSDMPGGNGGKDIYVCKRNGEDWDKPENLGPSVNTSGDEVFPYIREDGVLFISSNGHKGLGGFDIFSATSFNERWYLKRNEGSGINSEADDYGFVFSDSIHGYFSSNRKGGVGSDDLYRFTFSKTGINLAASLLLTENSNDPSKNTLVYLMNTMGQIIDSTLTNQKGHFQFTNIPGDKEYMAVIDPDEIEFKGKARFYLANTKGEIVRVSHSSKTNKFVFKNLPLEQSAFEMYTEEDLSLSGVLSYNKKPIVFIKNAELCLMNSFGDVIDTVRTNELGYFVFKNLVSKQDYLVSIKGSSLPFPIGTEVFLTDKAGNNLKSFIVGKDPFSFKLLSHEKKVICDLATDEELNFEFNTCTYGQEQLALKTLSHKKVYLLDKKGKIIDSLITDGKGIFRFKNLDINKDYTISVDETDLKFTEKKEYYLVNTKGNIVKVSYPHNNRKFSFRNIYVDSLSLQEITVDDKLIVAGNLLYGPKGTGILKSTRLYMLNEEGAVINVVTTNEFGCFAFRGIAPSQNYKLSISEADMNLPYNTKVMLTDKNGKVIKVFHVGKDKFEYEILAVHKNIMSALETDANDLTMKLNGYLLSSNKKPLIGSTMTLYDVNGYKFQIITTDAFGRFSFNTINANQVGHIEVTEKDYKDSVLFIADSKGRIRNELHRNHKGTFNYKLLDISKSMIADYTVDDPWLKAIEIKSVKETFTIVENITYKTNDYTFDLKGQRILDKTINVLKANPKLNLELGSHTDARSDEKYNLKLSNKRAKFAVNYIVSNGIDISRLKAIGYGETKLLNKCTHDSDCTENEHAQNRRTEFKINYDNTSATP